MTKWTTEQQEIIQAAARSKGSLMINAGAGCGKTSTLREAAKGVKVPALSLTFARSNTQALRGSLGPNWYSKSFNGQGHQAWGRSKACTALTLELDDKKLSRLVIEVSKEWKSRLVGNQWQQCKELVVKAMTEGVVPAPEGQGLRPDRRETWIELAEDIGVSEDDCQFLAELAWEVLTRDIREARAGRMSYDDQIYCSTLLGGEFPKFPLVAVDEDQDLSPLQIEMVRQCLRAEGRLVCVGDRCQAIYAWRGAAGDAESQLMELVSLDQWTGLPLMTSFRCPVSVAVRQTKHVPGFQAHPGNPYGDIQDWMPEDDQEGFWSWNSVQRQMVAGSCKTVALLCRINSPLVSIAFKLLRAGIGVQMLGRDIGAQAVGLAKRVVPDDSTSALATRAAIEEYLGSESSKLRANGHEERIQALEDRCGVLLAVLDSAGVETAGGLRAALTKLFARTEGQVTLSSIHRAKGLEWDLVVLLDPFRCPGEWAQRRGGLDLIQELNCRYVAETRTRHTLVLANLGDFR